MNKNYLVRPFDILVIILAIGLTLGIALTVFSSESGSSVVVVRDPERTWIFPIDADETVSAIGPIGETLVVIHEGRVEILSSPCSEKTCVAAGGLHRSGQWVACLPNRVFVRIEGAARPDDVDAVSW